MSGRKIVFIILGILATLCLIVVLFVGGIIGFAFYSIGHSEAAQTAKQFLRQNEKLKSDIGEVDDFGAFATGSINTKNSEGVASISLKTIGRRKTVNATVSMAYKNSGSWQVTDAYYVNDAGKTIPLLEKYEPDPSALSNEND
jgi:lipopolysaccharide export LptBFGC system permease protein LptF